MATTDSIVSLLNQRGGTFVVDNVAEDPVAALARALRRGFEDVAQGVKDLQEKDRIWVRRRTGTAGEKPAVGLHRRKRERPETAEGKRQDRYARHIPAYLPDSMCGPVVTRFVEPRTGPSTPLPLEESPEEETVSVPTLQLVLKGHLPEILTRVLKELQVRAVECVDCDHDFGGLHGELSGVNSCTALIGTILPEATASQAQYLNTRLGNVRMRRTVALGNSRFVHYVRMDIAEVTAEMIHAATNEADVTSSEDDDGDDLKKLLDHLDTLEAETLELQTRLTSVEANLARATAQLGERNQVIAGKNAEIGRKDAEIAALTAQVSALQEDVQLTQRLRETMGKLRGNSKK
jgi:uncharacterized coiled-coil protein SlyX